MHDVVDARGMPTVCITSPSSVAVAGVSSDGLTTTVLPQASAGATFHVISSSGRFHGQTTAITPFGTRTAKLYALRPSGVVISKNSVGAFFTASAKTRKFAAPRGMSRCEASERGLPVSCDLGIEEIVEAPVDLRGDGLQQVGALREREPSPRALQCRRSRPATAASTSGAPAFGHVADQAAVDRRAILELPPRGGGDELVADEMTESAGAHDPRPYVPGHAAVE